MGDGARRRIFPYRPYVCVRALALYRQVRRRAPSAVRRFALMAHAPTLFFPAPYFQEEHPPGAPLALVPGRDRRPGKGKSLSLA